MKKYCPRNKNFVITVFLYTKKKPSSREEHNKAKKKQKRTTPKTEQEGMSFNVSGGKLRKYK